jgi:hypothetical protein
MYTSHRLAVFVTDFRLIFRLAVYTLVLQSAYTIGILLHTRFVSCAAKKLTLM